MTNINNARCIFNLLNKTKSDSESKQLEFRQFFDVHAQFFSVTNL